MQPLVIIATRILGHRHQIHSAAWSLMPVDYRSCSNPDFRRDLVTATSVAGGFARGHRGYLPGLRAGISIEGVRAAVLGNHKQSVLRLAADEQLVHIERLGIHFAVGREEVDLSKTIEVDVGGSEDSL